MFSLHRRSTTFLCLVLATLLLAALPVAAAPASAPEERADLVDTARLWLGEWLESVLSAFGLTSDTEDTTGTEAPPATDPIDSTSTTTTEPTGSDGEGGNWDPNG